MIHKVTQLLILNTETIKSNYLDGKMPFLYFLFRYAKKYDKEHYTDYAFEILEHTLAEELSKQSHEDPKDIIGIGYSVMFFIEKDFFESDEINEILSIIDEYACHETERLSRTTFEESYIPDLIFLGNYFLKRLKCIHDDTYLLKIREHLQIIFFELYHHIDTIKKQNKKMMALCKDLFKQSFSNPYVGHFSKKGYTLLFSDSIPPTYMNLLIEANLLNTKGMSSNNQLVKAINSKIKQLVDELYSDKMNLIEEKILNLVILANVLLEEDRGTDMSYMMNVINRQNKILNENT